MVLKPILPGPVVTLLGLASAVVVLGGMRAAQGIIGPILLAFVIAIAVHPVQAWLRTRTPRWLALTLTVLVTYTILTAFAAALALSVLRFADQVGQYQSELNALATETEDRLLDLGVEQQQINDFFTRFDVNQIFSLVISLIQGLANLLTNLLFILALLFFVLIDANGIRSRMLALEALRPSIATTLRGFTHGVRKYVVVTGIFGAVVATLDVILLLVLDVPLPLLWGLLVFLASFVPTVGLIVGIVPPAAIALLDSGPTTALYVVVGFLLINNTIDNMVKPKFVGDAVGLSITTSFLSLIVWGFVLGPLGALLAIPTTLLARAVLIDGNQGDNWVGTLIGSEPTAPPRRKG